MNIPATAHIITWETWFTMILIVHVLAGFLALATFWIPLATVKGSSRHIFGGLFFLGAVGVAVICGIIMTLMRIRDPINPLPSLAHTTFFLYLCLFTAMAGWHGFRVFYLTGKSSPVSVRIEIILSSIVGIAGLVTAAIGLLSGDLLYTLFPFIGIGLALRQLRFWSSWPYEKFSIVMEEHMVSMLTCIIATFTAFCVIALPRIVFIGQDSLILWFGPTIVFLPVIFYWKQRLKSS